jgi:hypothetical protein
MPTNRPPNRRTTPPKATVSLDLDKLDNEDAQIEPFTARINGKVFTFADPGDMNYFDLTATAQTPDGEQSLLRKVLGDQYDDFAGPTTRQVMRLFVAWRDHYGMLDPGEALASVASSNGTAER